MVNKYIILISFCFIIPSFGREAGRPDFINTYGLYDTPSLGSPGNFDLTEKQELYTSPTGSDAVFVTLGQSRISNQSTIGSTQYVPTNGIKCININPYNGKNYKLIDPILGASIIPTIPSDMIGYHGQLCDSLINSGKYARVFFIPIAQSGSSVTDWISGGFANIRSTVAAKWLTSLGLTPTAWLWQQGNTDCINGMSQVTYETNLRLTIAYARGLPGRSSDKWMIAKDTVKDLLGTTCPDIEAAQTAIGGDSNNFIGPDADAMPITNYGADLHFNNTGNIAMSSSWSTKIQNNF